MTKRIYGEVKNITDIRKINMKIRKDVRRAKSRPALTELYKRSASLITLCHAPSWTRAFNGKLRRMKKVAKEEFTKTAKAINRRAEKLGLRASYDEIWGPNTVKSWK